MATKAECEAQQVQYYALLREALAAEDAGRFREAVEFAVASWCFVDGMMQFERKFESREFRSVETIDLVLKNAPLLFHSSSLAELAILLRTQKRIDKNASDDLAARLGAARLRMWDGHRLWSHLEQQPGARQDELRRCLGGDQDAWRSLAEAWDRMGILERTPDGGSYRLDLATRLQAPAPAKCPCCGLVGRTTKSTLLEPLECPKCHSHVEFVLLDDGVNPVSTR
ncbi:MAG: hypothetical protein HZA54_09770 [Planctomycetes bacterium]|nr:hypothetical protein [Planctomycetota bacterium]